MSHIDELVLKASKLGKATKYILCLLVSNANLCSHQMKRFGIRLCVKLLVNKPTESICLPKHMRSRNSEKSMKNTINTKIPQG